MALQEALAQLRDVVANDTYAMTFQSFGQYRTGLIKQIDNQAAAARLASHTLKQEIAMNTDVPLVAKAYPPDHPFPVALRRVGQLERALQSGVIVHLDALTTYTIAPSGGMRQDPQGPWVMKVDVMGHARSAHSDGEALALFTGKMHERLVDARKQGRSGWDQPGECSVDILAALLIKAVADGDLASVANYAMMLEQRSADTSVLPAALARYMETV